MNSKYAWRDVARQGLPKRSANQRAADFLEIYGLYDEATAREQASRCILCPNPSCVSGCPLCNPIPEWMQLTAEGRFLEAAAVLGSATNMAEICTRLCPSDHLCEGACLLDSVSEPVSIRALEQFLVEYAFARGKTDTATAPPNGKKVAVVGSGAGGLACAEELARKGYSVTVLDSELVPGGLLVNGTPAFKLDQSIVQRRIDLLKKCGVVFRLGLKLWDELSLEQMRTGFDSVFLCADWRKARPLQIPGADLKGVVQALPFLLQKKTPIPLDLPPFDVTGKKVIVLGGGDTAMDCLRAAVRYGASQATCLYRREELEMPCGRQEFRCAVEEGVQFVFRAAPVAVLGDEHGQVTGIRATRTEPGPIGAGGRQSFRIRSGTQFVLEADWVIAALGFEVLQFPRTNGAAELALNEWGGIVVDAKQMTNLPGVFAGGDLVHGPGPLLHAVRDARRAAQQIHAYLQMPVNHETI
ncbi:MAG TPA: NAD(P)-dependent oxidoreductase [Verrucomicrobiae bacterium]|nr:NAD(P)-dependent oxidoreductase [Verrucomicrobiae bacterium]